MSSSDLRCNIVGCSTVIIEDIVLFVKEESKTEVDQFDLELSIDENIIHFDITVGNVFGVAVCNGSN